MRIIVTTTWNSEDVIGLFLDHHRALGFDHVLVMDFDSDDATRDILGSPDWRDFVTLAPFPGLRALDSSNLMLAQAQAMFPDPTLCLFCDPDELLVLPRMDARQDLPPDLADETVSGWILPTFNVTCHRATAITEQGRMDARGALRYRAGGALRTDTPALIVAEQLQPPWIFTTLPGKVLVKLHETRSVKDGDHSAVAKQRIAPAPEGAYQLHYPFRTLDAFGKKIVIARRYYTINPPATPNSGWQIRRWIHLEEAGKLVREYLDQFPDEEEFDTLLADGSLVEDRAVIAFHARRPR